ncbi:MAG: sulfite exporter TauE/SafE family protein [Actinomycetota bacterium]|nr:sulfite exporter TauE/SafE family protein [Actinomycetota bacterium]
MDAGTVVLLIGAGLGAGAVNAVAGGGSLITFPALLAAGYPSVTANVTNALAVLPGYVGGSLAYRRELAGQGGRVRALALTSAVGAAAGAALLLSSSEALFEAIVPWLILGACGMLALQPRAAAIARRRRERGGRSGAPVLHAALFATAVYGGYFGAGLGIMLLAVLGVLLDDELQRLNALKGVLSLLIAVVTVVGFALFGSIAWDAALIIGAACLAGGAAGVHLARRLPAHVLRAVVIAYGVGVAIVLLV